MSFLSKRVFLHCISSSNMHYVPLSNIYKYLGPAGSLNHIRSYAARKGTREKRKKQKVKVEEKKVAFIPHNEREKEKLALERPKRRIDDSWMKLPTDDVYPSRYYRWKIYSFLEAVECHRETHHPDMYNQPNANLHLSVEVDMSAEKKNRFLDNFTKIAPIKHTFDHGEERSILAFSKDNTLLEEARQAGADLVGSAELIKQIQNGSVSIHDFQFVVAHPDILPELVVLRGMLKKKFPNIKSGTLEVDLPEIVNTFKTGINYTAIKDEYEKDFGFINSIIGTLNMDPKDLEENCISIINSVNTFKPKRAGSFITKCMLWSPPSPEKFKLDHNLYIKNIQEKPKYATEDNVEKIPLKSEVHA